ncbi:hypothetical protein RFI_34533, partial [Reticulomyxa filosa]
GSRVKEKIGVFVYSLFFLFFIYIFYFYSMRGIWDIWGKKMLEKSEGENGKIEKSWGKKWMEKK